MITSLPALGEGSFGSVREIDIESKQFALKIVQQKDSFGKSVSDEFYQEFMLSRLADLLGVGPKVSDIVGYDIIVTENHMFFCMEKCESSPQSSSDKIES